MISRDELIKNEDLLLEKAVGGIIGLAIGDSLGDAARTEHNRATYGITTDFNAKSAWSTDDTEFAMLTAKIVIDTNGEITHENAANIWINTMGSQTEYKRGGKSEIAAIENLLQGIMAPNSGKFNAFSESDGAAMRTAPIGIICAGDPKKAAELAKIEAEISHYREGVWAAQAVAAAVAVAMVDATIDEIIDTAISFMPKDSWLYHNTMRALNIVEENNGNIFDVWMKLHDAVYAHYWSASPEAIPATFACLKLMNGNFRDGLVLASNYGRDADTIGAVAGAILGAKYGKTGIPKDWIERTRYSSGTCLEFTKDLDIIDVGEKLAGLIK